MPHSINIAAVNAAQLLPAPVKLNPCTGYNTMHPAGYLACPVCCPHQRKRLLHFLNLKLNRPAA